MAYWLVFDELPMAIAGFYIRYIYINICIYLCMYICYLKGIIFINLTGFPKAHKFI